MDRTGHMQDHDHVPLCVDLDGTLTLAVHDFALIRRELDIPADHDILGHLAGLPAESWRDPAAIRLPEELIAEFSTPTWANSMRRSCPCKGPM